MKAAPCLAFALLVACAQGQEPPARDAATPRGPVGQPAIDVVPVVSHPLDATVQLEGELSPYEAVAVFPRVTGLVADIPVDRGSVVRRGQLLVRLVAPELVAQRAEAEARVHGDQTTYDRLNAAARTPGVVAGHDLELADVALRGDRERARSLAAQEGYLAVRAPFDGVVSERNVHPGALVGPAAAGAATVPMVRVEHVARLRLTVAVPEQHAGEISEGAPATFVVRAWPQRTFRGTIRRLAHTLDVRTRSMPVELDVDNTDGALAPGMFASVAWPVRRRTPSLFVPPRAIVATTERIFVVRIRDGVVEQVPVQRGTTVGDAVEVFGPLAAGDLVARRGSEDPRPGTHVGVHLADADAGSGAVR